MNDMVERVAEAFHAATKWQGGAPSPPWAECQEWYKKNIREAARAALAVVREQIMAVAAERKAIYETLAERRDAFADNTLNEHEKHEFAVEVMEYVEASLARVFDQALGEGK